jgi:AraC-like DNA-binding protein
MAELTVGAGFAKGLYDFAVAKGAQAKALAEQAGIDPRALEDQDRRLPFSKYVALMRAAKALTGDPALGLHYGEAVDISRISIVGLIGQASADMMEALAQLNRFVRLIVETENEGGGDRFRVALDARGLWTLDARLHANAFPELSESAFAQIVCAPRRLGDGPPLKSVHFTHPDPGYRAEYERIFQAPVVFESDRNALQIDVEWASHQVQRLPRYAFGVLTAHAEEQLAELENSKSLRGRIEALLLPGLHVGAPPMDAIAEKLGLGRQTLYRKLKAEGFTFEQVLDELRHRMAVQYLTGRKVSVNEAAYLVGFSDPAAFSRAFKRWTGESPKTFRDRP